MTCRNRRGESDGDVTNQGTHTVSRGLGIGERMDSRQDWAKQSA